MFDKAFKENTPRAKKAARTAFHAVQRRYFSQA
jgi:hypothetical protein